MRGRLLLVIILCALLNGGCVGSLLGGGHSGLIIPTGDPVSGALLGIAVEAGATYLAQKLAPEVVDGVLGMGAGAMSATANGWGCGGGRPGWMANAGYFLPDGRIVVNGRVWQ